MQHSNVVPGKCGFAEALTDAEIEVNLKLVRDMKAAACGRSLTDEELDQVVEPIDCKRTRCRLAGGATRQEKL
jgi:hypothetical protein